jgi:hypothetical protein
MTKRTATSKARRIGSAASALAVTWMAVGAAAVGLAAPAAFADSGSGATAGSTGGGGGAASLGGFQLKATGAGFRTTYAQPNFPLVPELNVGYSTTSYGDGPTGTSTASTLWPGQVAANAGSQLPLLLQPIFGSNTPNVAAPPWPLQASTNFPEGPFTATQDGAGANQEATSSAGESAASTSFGTASGPGAAIPSAIVSVQSLGSSVLSTVTATGVAESKATSAVHAVNIANGLITVGTVSSTQTATSDGTIGKVDGSSVVSGVSVAGQPVTVDSTGVHAGGQTADVLSPLLPPVGQLLQTLGISMKVTKPLDTVSGPSAEREASGLTVIIDLTQLDSGLNQLAAGLPPQIQSALNQLPLPLPNKQVVTFQFGWLDVQSAASPAFSTDLGGLGLADTSAGTGLDSGSTGLGSSVPALSDPGSVDLGSAGIGAASGATAATHAGEAIGTLRNVSRASSPVVFFGGLGSGLVALALVAAVALAGVLLRADSALAAVAEPGCPDDK